MECAGFALARRAARLCGGRGEILLILGPGNNGGDGWVAARHLHLWGQPVSVHCATPPATSGGAAAENRARAQRVGVREHGAGAWPRASVVVDCLLGTGVNRAPTGALAAAIAEINGRRDAVRILAADLPSGVDADRGVVWGEAVRAHETLTFGLPKLGMVLPPGREHCGEVSVARIGIADHHPERDPDARLLTAHGAAALLPARDAEGHKGSFGHVLVVAGSPGMSGAAVLAANAALRAGAGRITIACPEAVEAVIAARCTEATTAGLPAAAGGGLGSAALPALRTLAEARDVVVLGPGIGRDPEAQSLVAAFALELNRPMVLDADALYALPERVTAERRAPTLLTPHPGEAGALLGRSAADVNADRPGAAREIARRFGSVAILKGAGTAIAAPDGELWVNPTGGPILASGGTGDVLAGLLGGLLAQRCPPVPAAVLGAYLHGRAGDRIAQRRSAVGLKASELADDLPAAIAELGLAARSSEHLVSGAGVADTAGDVDVLPFP
jgi:NAD(P)H-hydrate epimerase